MSITNNKPDKQDTPDNNIAAHTPDKLDKLAQAHKPDTQPPACNNYQAQTKSYGKLPSEQHRNNHDTPLLDNADKLVSRQL
jgi:hypothetical protein